MCPPMMQCECKENCVECYQSMSMYIASTKVLHDKPSIRIAGQVTKDYVDTFNKQKKAVMGMLFKKPPTNDEDVVVIKGEPIDVGKAIKGNPTRVQRSPEQKSKIKPQNPLTFVKGFPRQKGSEMIPLILI